VNVSQPKLRSEKFGNNNNFLRLPRRRSRWFNTSSGGRFDSFRCQTDRPILGYGYIGARADRTQQTDICLCTHCRHVWLHLIRHVCPDIKLHKSFLFSAADSVGRGIITAFRNDFAVNCCPFYSCVVPAAWPDCLSCSFFISPRYISLNVSHVFAFVYLKETLFRYWLL